MAADSTDATPRIIEFDEIPSTSSEAMRLANAGDLGPFWVLARHQTKGRGRAGRTWQTARGNLAFSHLFEPRCPPDVMPQVALVAGVAGHAGLSQFWPEGAASRLLRLKWPNDIMIGAAKIGGILVETTRIGPRPVCIIGIGINLTFAPEVAGRQVGCLGSHATHPIELSAVAMSIAHAFARWQAIWDHGANFSGIRSAWLERAGPEGEPLMVNSGQGPIAGAFAGLDTDGALLLLDAEGRRQRFSFGDVTLASPEPKP